MDSQVRSRQHVDAHTHRAADLDQLDRPSLPGDAHADVKRQLWRGFDANALDARTGITVRADADCFAHGVRRPRDCDRPGYRGNQIYSVRYIDTFVVDARFDANHITGLRRQHRI